MSLMARTMLDALGDAIAAELSLSRQTLPIALWTHEAIEDSAADPYALLRLTGGQTIHTAPSPEVQVQALVVGVSTAAALQLAESIYDALHTSGRPRRGWDVGSHVIYAIRSARAPAQIGRDVRGRAELVVNFSVAYYPQES